MHLHVTVRPHPDEPFRVTLEQIDAAQAWLEERERTGVFTRVRPYVQTGGNVIVPIPDDMGINAARDWFETLWKDYPLRDTISWEVDVEYDTLQEGFDVLRGAVLARRPVVRP
jgi:hypothetical protein